MPKYRSSTVCQIIWCKCLQALGGQELNTPLLQVQFVNCIIHHNKHHKPISLNIHHEQNLTVIQAEFQGLLTQSIGVAATTFTLFIGTTNSIVPSFPHLLEVPSVVVCSCFNGLVSPPPSPLWNTHTEPLIFSLLPADSHSSTPHSIYRVSFPQLLLQIKRNRSKSQAHLSSIHHHHLSQKVPPLQRDASLTRTGL